MTRLRQRRIQGHSGRTVATVVLLAGACATRTPSAQRSGPDGPSIARIAPDTIALGRQAVPTIQIDGSGFEPGGAGTFGDGGNTVRVGTASIRRVAANADGTTLRFALPLTYSDTTSLGRPSSFTPGQYPVSVITPRGTSNSLTLTMIR